MDDSPFLASFCSLRAVLFSCALLLGFSAQADEIIYTWTDQDGVRHFAAQPPEGREYRIVEMPGAASSDSGARPDAAREPLAPAPSAGINLAEADPELLRERCEEARSMLDRLNQGTGDAALVDPAAREQMMQETEDFIAQWC